jgi:hypothetical protein
MAYQDRSQRNSSAPKAVIAAQIHKVENPDENAAFGCTATPQEIMGAAGNNFENQGGASWDAVISPFQIGGSSSKLPTMPTSASPACVVSQSNHVDPPVNDWTPPVIDISYLNPFKRNSDPVHGQGAHYDGTILFNGDKDDGQNLPNVEYADGNDFPEEIRPIALRGPLVIQGWGYDLNGKPIPNKEDDETDAQEGTFKTDDLKDEFLDDWIQKRETWPVAPVDLRYDRLRKVWTIPNTFRIIHVEVTGEEGIPAGATNPDCTPLNISSVYKADGTEVSEPKVTVTNPSWGLSISSGQKFYAFYDTKDCTYYPISSSGTSGCEPKVTGTGAGNSIAVTVSETSGCKTYNVSGCDPKVTGAGDITVTVSDNGGCKTYSVSGTGSDACVPTFTGLGIITVENTGLCNYTISGCETAITGAGSISVEKSGECGYTISGCEPTFTGLGTITVENTGGCNYTISGCEPTFTGLGGLTVENTGDCNYTISGCEASVTGGIDIEVTKDEEDCTYTIDFTGCHTKIEGEGCIIVTGPSPGLPCPEYLISLEPSCETSFNRPNWSINNYTVNSGDNISFSGSAGTGCGEVSFDVGTKTCIVQFPRQAAINGLGSISVAESGSCGSDDFGYTISGCSSRVTAGGSLYVTTFGEGDCTVYHISGSASGASGSGTAEYIDTDYCGWAATQTTCTEIPCLTLGSGLQIYEGTKLRSPLLEVEGTYTGCGSSAEGVSAARRITFGDNTTATKDSECLWTVKGLDQKIVGTEGVCGQDNLGSTDFQKLTFGKNLGVKKDAAGDCDYTISGLDQKIAGTGGVCAQDNLVATDFQKMTFGKNLGVKKDAAGDCDYTISGLDQKIAGTGGACAQDNLVATDFQKLTFGRNLGVTKDDAGECDYSISGLDQKIAATGGVCGHVDLDKTDFQKLTFGRNLGVTKDDAGECDYSISGLDQKIAATGGVCAQDDLVPPVDFQKLTFGSNLGVKKDEGTECDYSISGLDQKIRSTTTGCGFISGVFRDFTGIEFRENIGVTTTDCLAVVKGLDQKIEGTWFAPEIACGPDELVPVETFKKLTFIDNITIEKGEDCAYTISGLDQKISASVGQCPPLAAVAPRTFTELNFAENIAVDMEGTTCKAVIKGLSQQLMASGLTCMAGASVDKPASGTSNIQTWDFQKNIAVIQKDVAGCDWGIRGLDQLIEGKEGACGLSNVEEDTFRKLTFGKNLGVEMDDPTGGKLCEYTISGHDQKIEGLAGEGVHCGTLVGEADFTRLQFADGLKVTKNTEPDCSYKIQKVLKTSNSGVVNGRAGGQEGLDHVCQIEAGCGIKATDVGDGKTTFSLDNTSQAANFANDVEIQLVSDICCLGSGFDIKYRTITFSECGLFKGVTDEDACTPL